MADPKHVRALAKGVKSWNNWRQKNPSIVPDLRNAALTLLDLSGADLRRANMEGTRFLYVNLAGANLAGANIERSMFADVNLPNSDLQNVRASSANFGGTDLTAAKLNGGDFALAEFSPCKLSHAELRDANLCGAVLDDADLTGADLRGAHVNEARLSRAKLMRANFTGADLTGTTLNDSDLTEAILDSCHVYGVSAWKVNLTGTRQSNLRITPQEDGAVVVDNLSVAQFIYLLIKNENIRNVIDTITSKVVLILGSFAERKAVLDAIREELRKRNYVPILFDFQKPDNKDLTGTVTTLANMARFIIADLTDPRSVPHELATIVPTTRVAVQTIILKGQREYAMFSDLKKRHSWVLGPHRYKSQETLLADLDSKVIKPAEDKAQALSPRA